MSLSYEQAVKEMESIVAEYSDSDILKDTFNESDTRAKIITRMLTKVLGWPERAIAREGKSQTGFYDYLLSCPAPLLVVEAKRANKHFVFPTEKKNRQYALSSLKSLNQNVGKAVRQARTYADDHGVEYACATNGSQWIVFRAITRGGPWHEGRGTVFRSLLDILEDFTAFWNLLSFQAVSAGSLRGEFAGESERRVEYRRILSDALYADAPLSRNEYSTQLQPIIDGVFLDIVSESRTDVLQQCYISDRSISEFSRAVSGAFDRSIPRIAESDGFRRLYEGGTRPPALLDDFRRAVERGEYGTTILLLGGIGCGKTTFIHRFLKITAADLLADSCLWFYIPFTVAPVDSSGFLNFVRNEVHKGLRERYSDIDIRSIQALQGIYDSQLAEMREGVWSILDEPTKRKAESEYIQDMLSRDDHCDHVVRYLRRRGYAISVVLDNVDQRVSDEQIKIFLLAHDICKSFDATVLVALREESYFRAAQAGAFNAYHNIRYHIAPPNISELLRKRIKYTRDIAEQGPEALREKFRSNTAFSADDIALFMRILERSTDKLRFIDRMSGGNMRAALQMYSQFMVSGATFVRRMLDVYREDGNLWSVAEHEFIKAVMLGDFQYYKDERSPIPNLFQVTSSPRASNITALRVLSYLRSRAATNHREGTGFVEIHEILNVFTDSFGGIEDGATEILRLVSRRLVELDTRVVDCLVGARYLRITMSGDYLLRVLSGRFIYLDLICFDTPIWHNQARIEIWKRAGLTDLYERMERVEWLLQYLLLEERRSAIAGQERLVDNAFGTKLVQRIVDKYRKDLRRVEWSARLDSSRIAEIRERVKTVIVRDIHGVPDGE